MLNRPVIDMLQAWSLFYEIYSTMGDTARADNAKRKYFEVLATLSTGLNTDNAEHLANNS